VWPWPGPAAAAARSPCSAPTHRHRPVTSSSSAWLQKSHKALIRPDTEPETAQTWFSLPNSRTWAPQPRLWGDRANPASQRQRCCSPGEIQTSNGRQPLSHWLPGSPRAVWLVDALSPLCCIMGAVVPLVLCSLWCWLALLKGRGLPISSVLTEGLKIIIYIYIFFFFFWRHPRDVQLATRSASLSQKTSLFGYPWQCKISAPHSSFSLFLWPCGRTKRNEG